jgi:ribosomal protein S18 acetylase RimI-like enzyme
MGGDWEDQFWSNRSRFGSRLLTQILGTAKMKYPAVSLSVRANNPVIRLYERTGFMKIPGSEVVNRAGEVLFNMMYEFR